jgi:hypothetical protein
MKRRRRQYDIAWPNSQELIKTFVARQHASSSSSSWSRRRAIRARALARTLATGALLAFVEVARTGAFGGSSAVCGRGTGAGLGAGAGSVPFGAEEAALSGLDDGTGAGATLGAEMTIAVCGDGLLGFTARPPRRPNPRAAKPPIIKRSMMRLSAGVTDVLML